jgi:hypothetical protein
VLSFLEREFKASEERYSDFAISLPPLVLNLLCGIPRGMLEESNLLKLRPGWHERRNQKLGTADKRDRIPLFIGARILAYHILQGTGNSTSILRLATTVLGGNWRRTRSENSIGNLDHALQALRSPWRETQAKVQAIDELSKELECENGWKEIENFLYHQIFSWPLLVFAGHAMSFPVSIDVDFEGKKPIEIVGDGVLAVSGWEPYLRKAAEAARKMWRAKHGNFGPFREKVDGVSVIYDFRVAEKIASGFPAGRFALVDQSMQAYFSQVVLSRLLGNAVAVSRVATGSIGEESKEEFGNYAFEWPDAVTEKLNYVFRTHSFERVILPNLEKLPTGSPKRRELARFLHEHGRNYSTEINFVESLQNVADSFQVGGWRQHRYVRCPDIVWRVHPSGEHLPSYDTPQVQECIKSLRNNERPVLDLSDKTSPIELAAALWHINVKLRNAISLNDRPPMISWAFVRAVPDELDARFWQVVWQVTGAEQQDFDDFHGAATTESAGHYLAKAFNCFSPHEKAPNHRAQDIVVIIGTKYLSETLARAKNPLLRCHAFDPLINYLSIPGVLRSVPDPKIRKFLGNTRIITFRTDSFPDETTTEAESGEMSRSIVDSLSRLRLTQTEAEHLDQLSVFRFGFTQQMASLFLGNLDIRGLEVRKVLRKYVKRGYLRYRAGEYYMPNKIGQSLTLSDDSTSDAKTHYRAANAIAPYLATVNLPGLDFDEAFRAEHVHEANYHLGEALNILNKTPGDPYRAPVWYAYWRLLLFAEYPGWNTLKQLLKIKRAEKDAYELASNLLEMRRNSGVPPHPEQLVTGVKAVEQWLTTLRRDRSLRGKDRLGALALEIANLLREAEQTCDTARFADERDYNLARVLTKRAAFLHRYRMIFERNDIDDEFMELSERALELIRKSDVTAATPEWFEFLGDNVENHREAIEFYRLGISSEHNWHQLWIKLIGSSCLAFADRGVTESICDELPEGIIEKFRYLARSVQRDIECAKPWVKPRWKSCINLLLKRYAENPEIQEHLQSCVRELMKWGSPTSSGGQSRMIKAVRLQDHDHQLLSDPNLQAPS